MKPLAAAEGTVLAGPLNRDTLAATLGEAADAVRAELARFEALVAARSCAVTGRGTRRCGWLRRGW